MTNVMENINLLKHYDLWGAIVIFLIFIFMSQMTNIKFQTEHKFRLDIIVEGLLRMHVMLQ